MTDIATSPVAVKKPLFLSASRIDLFLQCSQRYAARYLLKLPDAGNDGSNRGSVCHDVLEVLHKPCHRRLYDAAIHHDTFTEVPALWRFVQKLARRYGVHDPVNLHMIDQFLMVGLKQQFHGPKGTKQLEIEREFTITVDAPDGRRYAVRGFIDRVAHVEDQWGIWLSCRDWKSSKGKFDDADETIQSQVYQLALRHLYPLIPRRTFEYVFLKFPRVPIQSVTPMTDGQLNGFEWRLTEIQKAVEAFTLDDVGTNLLAFSGDYNMIRKICGKEGLKVDGTKAWICPARLPMHYWAVVDAAGAVVTSAFGEIEAMQKADEVKGQRVEQRWYSGCSAFFNEYGRPRNYS